jgi:ubiquinol-cytochrome c reductase cytochrome b subunit
MGLVFWGILFVSGATDVLAASFDVPFELLVWAGRIGLLVLPPLAYVVVRRICVGLQRADRDVLERGVRTGVLQERPDGVYVEVRRPPGGADREGRPIPLEYGGARVDHRPATSPGPVGEEPR